MEDIDRDIIQLLSKRKKITDDIVKFKSQQQAKVFTPAIEEAILTWRGEMADEHKLCKDLIVDVFRLVLFDAYHLSCTSHQKVQKGEAIKQLLFIGDSQPMGTLFSDLLSRSGYQCLTINAITQLLPSELEQCSAIFITDSLKSTLDTLVTDYKLRTDTLIVNVDQVDTDSMSYLTERYLGPSVGLNPMFSASSKAITKEVVFICHGNMPTRYVWLVEQLKMWGLTTIHAPTTEHDQLMLSKSVLNQFTVLFHAMKLMTQGVDLEQLLNTTGPHYRLQLVLMGQYFSKSKQLKLDTLMTPDAIAFFKSCEQEMARLVSLLENGEREQLEKLITDIQAWFGEYADKFDDESNRLSRLQPLNDTQDMLG
nr:chorismate mutase [Marinifaba aquimaris]